MKNSSLLTVLQLIVAIAVLINGIIAWIIAYQTFERGPTPEKHLYSHPYFAFDMLEGLRQAGSVVSVSVNSDGAPLKNLYGPVLVLENNGASPITPSDYFGSVKLKAERPWKILSVLSNNNDGARFDWKRIDDYEYQADPILINPGDKLTNTVYLTSTEGAVKDKPLLKWEVRINNLSAVEYDSPTPEIAKPVFPQLLPLEVYLDGNDLLLMLMIFSLYLSSYIILFRMLGYLGALIWRDVLSIVLASLMSLGAADASETYLTQPLENISHVWNIPVLLLNITAIGVLLYNARVRLTSASELG